MANDQQQLDDQGYAVLRDLIGGDLLSEMQEHVEALFTIEGDRAGGEFRQEAGSRRLANLVAKGRLYWDLLTYPRVLPLVKHVLNDSVKISSLNVRSINAKWNRPQPLHCDMRALPDELGYWVCNVVWH